MTDGAARDTGREGLHEGPREGAPVRPREGLHEGRREDLDPSRSPSGSGQESVALHRLAITAHDVAKPLAVIQQQARRLAAGSISPERIRAAGEELVALSRDGLAILESCMAALRPEILRDETRQALGSLLEQVVGQVGRLHPGRRLDVASAVPEVAIERPGELSAALVNLLDNALHACRRPGAAVRLAASSERGEEIGATLRIEVRDSGRGMPERVRARAVEPFFTTRLREGRGEGRGLGLASARARIESLGGSLQLESAPGAGTRATIRLPLSAPNATKIPDATKISDPMKISIRRRPDRVR